MSQKEFSIPSPPNPSPSEPSNAATRKPPIRVSAYTEEYGTRICERIACTPQSLRRICEAPDMPSMATLFRWLKEHQEFSAAYIIAKQFQIDLLVEEMLDIVDDSSGDVIVTKDGKTIINTANVKRSQMRLAARQWLASKLLPSKYGAQPTEQSAHSTFTIPATSVTNPVRTAPSASVPARPPTPEPNRPLSGTRPEPTPSRSNPSSAATAPSSPRYSPSLEARIVAATARPIPPPSTPPTPKPVPTAPTSEPSTPPALPARKYFCPKTGEPIPAPLASQILPPQPVRSPWVPTNKWRDIPDDPKPPKRTINKACS